MIATVVLAAGKGVRMGGPKALLVLPSSEHGEPLSIAHVRARLRGESERVILVVRAAVAEVLAPWLDGLDVKLVVSEEPDEHGPAGSLRAAVQSGMLHAATELLVTPVDVAPVSTDVTRRLLAPLIDGSARASRPRHGHPVAVLRSVLDDAYDLAVDLEAGRSVIPPPLRDVLSSLGTALHVIDDDLPRDWNSPGDLP